MFLAVASDYEETKYPPCKSPPAWPGPPGACESEQVFKSNITDNQEAKCITHLCVVLPKDLERSQPTCKATMSEHDSTIND